LSPVTALPKWTPGLSVGNARLDEQHITLLELGRNLFGVLQTHPPGGERVRWMLDDIVRLTRDHDAMEEQILAQNGCPTLDEHRAAHRAARETIEGLRLDASNGLLNADHVSRVIADWMSHHIAENDLPVKAYLKAP